MMRVNMNKSNVMLSDEHQKLMQKAVRWHVVSMVEVLVVQCNSIQCTSCQTWLHKKCSGIKGGMSEVMK